MRTTLTIDEDVATLLDREVQRSGDSFKETVNKALRVGLVARRGAQRERFVVRPMALGLPAIDSVEALIETLEGPLHK